MLLVIDVGNTNTVMGAFDGAEVVHHWRISTIQRTTDEFGLLFVELLRYEGLTSSDIDGVAVSCVVPSVLYAIEKASRRYLDQDALVVGQGIRTGMRVRTDNPREVGADRIVNAVAAVAFHGCPCVVVDFGTATTFDCVDARGDYIGGAISPGFKISADALFHRTAKLPRVEIERPDRTIGRSTIASMQSGLFWGYVGLVDRLARRCKEELAGPGGDPTTIRCVATGGLARLVGQDCEQIDTVDDFLTLHGLRILWERNNGV